MLRAGSVSCPRWVSRHLAVIGPTFARGLPGLRRIDGCRTRPGPSAPPSGHETGQQPRREHLFDQRPPLQVHHEPILVSPGLWSPIPVGRTCNRRLALAQGAPTGDNLVSGLAHHDPPGVGAMLHRSRKAERFVVDVSESTLHYPAVPTAIVTLISLVIWASTQLT
jgi:hypothetical protein